MASSTSRRRYVSKAMRDVIAERTRQMEKNQWDEEHDDQHTDESLAIVAAIYALPPSVRSMVGAAKDVPPFFWPDSWLSQHYKPRTRRRDLVRAAALLVAEIQRLDRAEAEAHIRKHSWEPMQ